MPEGGKRRTVFGVVQRGEVNDGAAPGGEGGEGARRKSFTEVGVRKKKTGKLGEGRGVSLISSEGKERGESRHLRRRGENRDLSRYHQDGGEQRDLTIFGEKGREPSVQRYSHGGKKREQQNPCETQKWKEALNNGERETPRASHHQTPSKEEEKKAFLRPSDEGGSSERKKEKRDVRLTRGKRKRGK